MCEEAGVIGPYPTPINAAPNSTMGSEAVATQAMPAPPITSPAWLTRMAPRRFTGPPASAADRQAAA